MTAPGHFDPVLVTGGAGFVGACTVHELLRRGHRVHVLLRPQSNLWRLRSVLERIHVHLADISDAPAVRDIVQKARPRAVVHLATHGAYEHQADAAAILQTNILGTYHLLDACAAAGVEVFVSAGSSSEYGFKTHRMQETDRLEPNSIYAVGKAAQTHLCQFVAQRASFGVVVFRLFSVYGPWEEPTRLMPTLLRRARAGFSLEMVAPRVVRDFIYIDDVVDALLRFSAATKLRGEVINLGTGIETSLQEVVATVQQLVGNHSEVRWGAMPPRSWDSTCWVADVSRAAAMLDWRPRHTVRQGLTRMAAWIETKEGDDGSALRRVAG
jgi:nucleoside-diphosphate-sugar epimerase